jgi:carboxypeptidase C (cathepsin A)
MKMKLNIEYRSLITVCLMHCRGWGSLFVLPILLVHLAIGAPSTPDTGKEKPSEEKPSEPKEIPPVVTEHSVALPGSKTLSYKAITGYILIRDTKGEVDKDAPKESSKPNPIDPSKGKPKAQIFFTAYILNGVTDPASRPVTYAFNGGPGSASLWLQLGAIGPRRVVLSDRGEALAPPAKIVDNEATWLDKTDLVFIDPVSTGFSRAIPGEEAKQFYGYKEDLESVGNFIRLWTTRYGRWASPKIIAGESYGTTRAAGLSDYLQDTYGMYVNGIVLISSVLNFQTLEFSPGNNVPYPLYLPSYTAAAWYHQRLPQDLQQLPLSDVLSQAENFSLNDYLVALAKGDSLSEKDKDRISNQLARFTGIDATRLKRKNLREEDALFFVDLLRDKSRSIGRYDSRFTGIRLNPGTDKEDSDPSFEAVNGTFRSAYNDYVRRELNFETDLPYDALASVRPWPLAENKFLDVADNLKRAMSRSPYLKVWMCCGYYDLATPYLAAKQVVHGMLLDPTIQDNFKMTYYDAGHMMYIDKPSREKMRNDFDDFLRDALSAKPVEDAGRD